MPSEGQLLLQKGIGPCYTYQPQARFSTATGDADSASRRSDRSLKHIWDIYKALNLDANLKLNAAQMKVPSPNSLSDVPCCLGHRTFCMAGAVPLRWLCCGQDSLCSLQIYVSLDSRCTLAM